MTISIANDYSAYVLGRYKGDSDFNGTDFRNKHFLPAILKLFENDDLTLTIDLDGLFVCDPSFLEETFGGTIRALKEVGKDSAGLWNRRVLIKDSDDSELKQIQGYIKDELSV